MSNWCQSHPTYSAKREPNSLCGSCWQLWFYRCPEEKAQQVIVQYFGPEQDERKAVKHG